MRELSIKGIKKDIIDKMLDSPFIVELFYNEHDQMKSISDLKGTYIFDYCRRAFAGFISVDVLKMPCSYDSECETRRDFKVVIEYEVPRNKQSKSDKLSDIIENIIKSLYSYENYTDIPLRINDELFGTRFIRKISFIIRFITY